MKSIHGLRVHLDSIDSADLVENLDLHLDDECQCGECPTATIQGPVQTRLEAGGKTLAIVLDKKWGEELEALLNNWFTKEETYKKQIENLCDEINQLKLDARNHEIQSLNQS